MKLPFINRKQENEDEPEEKPKRRPFNYSAYPRINVRLIVLLLMTILLSVVALAVLDAKALLPFDAPVTLPTNLPKPISDLLASPTATGTATPIPPTPTPTPTATPEPTMIAREQLGNLDIVQVDESSTVSLQVDPTDNMPYTLEVRDASGYVWRLDVPPDALFSAAVLRMSAISSKPNAVGLAPDSGVVLEPAGLVLLKPVRLSVKLPPGTQDDGLFLVANHVGAALRFGEIESGDASGEFKTWIYNFGIVQWTGSNPDRLPIEYAPEALAEYERALTFVAGLQGNLDPPQAPPESLPACPPANPDAALQASQESWLITSTYIRDVIGADMDAALRLLGARTALVHLGLTDHADSVEVDREFLQRRVLRSAAILNQYYTPELPRSRGAVATNLVAVHLFQHLGGDGQDLLNDLKANLYLNIERLTTTIKEQNAYDLFPQAVLQNARLLALTDPNIDPTRWQNLVIDGLRFSVDVKYEIKGTLPDKKRIHYVIQGTLPIQPSFTMEGIIWQSPGEMVYQSGTFGELKVAEGSSFPVQIKLLQFDDCNQQQFMLAFDRLGAEQEQYLLGDRQVPGQGLAQQLSRTLLEPQGYYDLSSRQFIFLVDRLDKRPVFETQVNTQSGSTTATLIVRLIHQTK